MNNVYTLQIILHYKERWNIRMTKSRIDPVIHLTQQCVLVQKELEKRKIKWFEKSFMFDECSFQRLFYVCEIIEENGMKI